MKNSQKGQIIIRISTYENIKIRNYQYDLIILKKRLIKLIAKKILLKILIMS